ncbi:MAG: MoaD/ThiS family protein [Chloroflexi bacterium]|nr:MoaD/ThiS family protein [Chloroflexota bacterium]
MKVTYYGLVRNVVGLREEEVTLSPEATVRDLLRVLVERHGNGLRDSLLASEGNLRFTARILLGEEDIGEMGGLDTKVDTHQRASIVVVVYPVEGG